jgi:hypothetical protein
MKFEQALLVLALWLLMGWLIVSASNHTVDRITAACTCSDAGATTDTPQ